MNILVFNCGSSSLNYKLYHTEADSVLASGTIVWNRKCNRKLIEAILSASSSFKQSDISLQFLILPSMPISRDYAYTNTICPVCHSCDNFPICFLPRRPAARPQDRINAQFDDCRLILENRIFNKESGLLGVSGFSSDLRDIENQIEENDRAKLALDMYAYRLKQYIGAYMATLGGADLLIFTDSV